MCRAYKAVEAIITRRLTDFENRIEKIDRLLARIEQERGSLAGLEGFGRCYIKQAAELIESGFHTDLTVFLDAVNL